MDDQQPISPTPSTSSSFEYQPRTQTVMFFTSPQTPQPTTLLEFKLFKDLPVELRLKIWRQIARTRRVLRIEDINTAQTDANAVMRSWRWELVTQPGALLACREAWHEMIPFYTPITIKPRQLTLVNLDVDVLLIQSQTIFQAGLAIGSISMDLAIGRSNPVDHFFMVSSMRKRLQFTIGKSFLTLLEDTADGQGFNGLGLGQPRYWLDHRPFTSSPSTKDILAAANHTWVPPADWASMFA